MNFSGSRWAMEETALRALVERYNAAIIAHGRIEATASQEEIATAQSSLRVERGIAIINIRGSLFQYNDLWSWFFGGSTYESIEVQFRAALQSPEVKSILFDVNSPGGEVDGCNELATLIYKARGTKPSLAYVMGYGASAAYELASSASVIVTAPDAMLGSIGVKTVLYDTTAAMEQDGVVKYDIVSSQSPYKVVDPASKESRDRVQAIIDDTAAVFVKSVAQHRGVTEDQVLENFGKGDCFVGSLACDAGLADYVDTLENTLAFMAKQYR